MNMRDSFVWDMLIVAHLLYYHTYLLTISIVLMCSPRLSFLFSFSRSVDLLTILPTPPLGQDILSVESKLYKICSTSAHTCRKPTDFYSKKVLILAQ